MSTLEETYQPFGLKGLSGSGGALALAFSLAVVLFLACDVLADSGYGFLASVAIAGGVLFTLKKRSFALLFVWAVLAFPDFPRGIVDLYYDEKGFQYDVISTARVLGAPIVYWLILVGLGAGAFAMRKRLYLLLQNSLLPLAMLAIGVLGMGIEYVVRGFPDEVMPFIQADAKLPLMVVAGLAAAGCFASTASRRDIANFFFLFPMILGIKAVFAVSLDVATGSINLDAGTRGLFSAIVVAYILWTGERGWYSNPLCRALLYINLLTVGRSEMAQEAALIMVGFLVGLFRHRRLAVSMILELLVLVALALAAIAAAVPKLLEFILWKASDFTPGSELSGSGQVRIEEIRNVLHLLTDNPLNFLFGKGIGAHFRYDWRPFPQIELLDLNAYGADQLSSGNIYTPHTSLAYVFLKFGLVGFLIYLWIPLRAFMAHLRSARLEERLFLPLILVLALNYFWRPLDAVVLGLLLGIGWMANSGPRQPISSEQV